MIIIIVIFSVSVRILEKIVLPQVEFWERINGMFQQNWQQLNAGTPRMSTGASDIFYLFKRLFRLR